MVQIGRNLQRQTMELASSPGPQHGSGPTGSSPPLLLLWQQQQQRSSQQQQQQQHPRPRLRQQQQLRRSCHPPSPSPSPSPSDPGLRPSSSSSVSVFVFELRRGDCLKADLHAPPMHMGGLSASRVDSAPAQHGAIPLRE
ncbi:forkhead box protein J2-like [Schistocerca serialis cubense]|uniref:forkhead box protein J2-like n=1 Tax=Schistocerca serialis cubense TaxID=2023355 RepID=UPI00214EBC7B|nr:forkhead box protein J2-like [Schistocerca serialis cubense]